MKQIGGEKFVLPGFLLEPILEHLRSRIKREHEIDIKLLQPLKCMGTIDTPLLFITSKMDEFVRSEDVVQLYIRCSSRSKQLEFIDKLHNSSRNEDTIITAVNFMLQNLQEQKKSKPMKVFNLNNTMGGNMADLIIKAEKERK